MMSSNGVAAPPTFVKLAGHPLRWRILTELAVSDYRVRELVARVEHSQNLISYHLGLLRSGGLVSARRSSHDGRDSYYHLELDRCKRALGESGAALHPSLRYDPPATEHGLDAEGSILFVCTGNSSRSPMAEALMRLHTNDVAVTSGGSKPKGELHPDTIRALKDVYDIDVSDQRPQHLDTLVDQRFSHVVTLCDRAREVCPEFPHHPRQVHWSIPDPAADEAGGYDAFQQTAAEIDTRVRHLLPTLATINR